MQGYQVYDIYVLCVFFCKNKLLRKCGFIFLLQTFTEMIFVRLANAVEICKKGSFAKISSLKMCMLVHFLNDFKLFVGEDQDQHVHQSASLGNLLAKSCQVFHFSDSLVKILAKSLVNMLAESLVNMFAKSLVSMSAEPLVNILVASLVNMMAESLVNILAESLVKMLARSLVNMFG